jgi:hypothetical protein
MFCSKGRLDFGAQEALPVLSYVTIMSPLTSRSTARREFLKFLAASPYVAALGGVAAFLERGPLAQNTAPTADVIQSPSEALNVLDFEEAAHRKVPPGLGLHGQRRER